MCQGRAEGAVLCIWERVGENYPVAQGSQTILSGRIGEETNLEGVVSYHSTESRADPMKGGKDGSRTNPSASVSVLWGMTEHRADQCGAIGEGESRAGKGDGGEQE